MDARPGIEGVGEQRRRSEGVEVVPEAEGGASSVTRLMNSCGVRLMVSCSVRRKDRDGF
jgi:hypothetical protein